MIESLRETEEIELIENLDFHRALVQNGKVCCEDTCLNDLDRFVWYSELENRPGSFDLKALRTLAREVEVMNDPNRIEIGLDKYRAHLVLRDAGCSVPEFVLFDHRVPEKMGEILEEWGAAVLKPRRGGRGKGVTLIDSPARLRDTVGYVQSTAENSPDQSYFLERYYDNDPQTWASITMINGNITQAYRKVSDKFQDLGGADLNQRTSMSWGEAW